MCLFKRHVHEWKEISRTYAEPIALKSMYEEITYRGVKPSGIEGLVLGVTTILWECQDKNCRKLRKEELLGEQI